MAARSSEAELVAAWSALAAQPAEPGWTTVAVAEGAGRFRAGVRHPDNAEALLVGFGQVARPAAAQLPKGRGFLVEGIAGLADPVWRTWFALSREPAGSRDLFAGMADDVIGTLSAAAPGPEATLLQTFLSRIRAWQTFMQRPDEGVLTLEAQIGLIGELVVLERLIELVRDPLPAVQAWEGPMDGTQDFSLGHGAIEVKATVSANGFPAKIASLEQLDQSVRSPVLIAAVRLALQDGALTLAGWIDRSREQIGVGAAAVLFEDRLLHAGYLDASREHYTTPFEHSATRLIGIAPDFPCLARSAVPPAILQAEYRLDLDQTAAPPVDWEDALQLVGLN